MAPSRQQRVPDFYHNKSILITGAAGYLGVVILEVLLRTCPGIHTIYLLLREKKGLKPQDRLESIFNRKIFSHLKEKSPECLQKVCVIGGDVTLPNLGIVPREEKLLGEVSIVFHCAASISFLKPLKFMMLQNSYGTYNILEFSKKLKHLKAFVYTSTAYSNSNRRSEIEEIVYRLPFPAKRFLEEIKCGSERKLETLVHECKPGWPNHYTFSKCLAENIVLEYGCDLPTLIIRPSIIISCWKGIRPGYIEEGSGMVDLGIAVGKGFVRAIHGDPQNQMDFIPVDIVANAHVVGAWSVALESNSCCRPLVVNCTAGEVLQSTLRDFHNELYGMALRNPLPKSFQTPSSSIQKNALFYWSIVLFEHYIPALVIDALLKISGRKPRLMSLYRFYDAAALAMNFFLTHSWRFENVHFKNLAKQLHPQDEELLYLDTSTLNLRDLVREIPRGSPFYEWGLDTKDIGERKRITFVRYLLTCFIKGVVLSVAAALFLLPFL